MKTGSLVRRFAGSLSVPTGRLAGSPVRLAPFQKRFIDGAFAPGINVGVLSVGRGGGKSTISAILALGELTGAWTTEAEREIVLAARTQQQAQIVWSYVASLARTLPEDIQARITIRRQPRFEIQYDDERGPHILRAISADGKSALGSSPTMCVMDERGHWPLAAGDDLEAALLTGLSKRDGKGIIISTSASTDTHPFSVWCDRDAPGVFVQEHRPQPSLPVDDVPSLLVANPGSKFGIGPTLARLKEDAALAIQRGGSSLSRFRLYSRNERVAEDNRATLLQLDDWLAVEADDLPPRQGSCIVGVDLGGSVSMSAVVYYWPASGRLESYGTFPGSPDLDARGLSDAVGDAYLQMQARGELATLGDRVVPVSQWLSATVARIAGESIAAIVCDRFRSAELEEALRAANIRAPVVYRGQGFRDSNEDIERFRAAVFDRQVKHRPSLLMRHALSEAVVLIDPAGNCKIAKGRSRARIDAAAACILAVAEGARQAARPAVSRRIAWA